MFNEKHKNRVFVPFKIRIRLRPVFVFRPTSAASPSPLKALNKNSRGVVVPKIYACSFIAITLRKT